MKQRYPSHDSEGVNPSRQDAAFEREASKDIDLKTQSHYRSGLQTPIESVHTSPSSDQDTRGGTAPASGFQQDEKEGPRSSSVINKYNIALRSNPLRPAKQPDDLDTALPEDEQYYHLLDLHEQDVLMSRNYWQYMPSPSPSCSPPSSPPPASLRFSSAPDRNTTESYRQAEHAPARFAHPDDNAQAKPSPSIGHARRLADQKASQPSHEPRRVTAYRNKHQETHTPPPPTNDHDEEAIQSAEEGQPPPKTAKREKKQTRRAKRKIELEARNKAREASRKIRKERRMIEHVARVKAAEAAGLTAEEAGLTPLDRAGKPAGTVTEEQGGESEDVGSRDTASLVPAVVAAVVVVDPAPAPASVVAVAAAVRPARATAPRVSARRKAFAACPGVLEG